MRREDSIPSEGPRLSVIRIKAKDHEVTLWVVGRRIRGFRSHWNGQLTVECTKEQPEDCCPLCDDGIETRWRGYLDVIVDRNRDRGFLELTAAGSESLILCVNGEDNLRGARIKVFRGQGDKTRMRFAYMSPANVEQLRLVPEELDPHDTVVKLYQSQLKKIPRAMVDNHYHHNGKAQRSQGGEA